MDSEDTPRIELPIRRIIPPDLETKFVNSIVVQHQSDYFIVHFFEALPPIVLTEEDLKSASELGAVESQCVARLIVSPKGMQAFISSMQENYENWLSAQNTEDEVE